MSLVKKKVKKNRIYHLNSIKKAMNITKNTDLQIHPEKNEEKK